MMALSLGGAKVLIVEDNFVVADALRFLIDGYGGSVSAIVPTVQRAHEVLAAGTVDIAVLDINLNGASVVPLAEHLRGHPRFDKPVEAERLVRAMITLTGGTAEP